ncbi:glycosyltransferase [Candidatus Bathyarchaeota archaeon]|nr:glycosyltransferase [Candidatus Bathyarchaeota archaeon]
MRDTGEHKLNGIKLFTDETGILQHSKFGVIDRRHGYCTDDNSRALMAAVRHHQRYGESGSLDLAKRYLEFLLFMHIDGAGFHNLLSYDKRYLDEEGTEDSIGHTLWATGRTINSRAPHMLKQLSRMLFDESLPKARDFTSPRGRSFALLGLCEYSKAHPRDDNLQKDIVSFANFLVDRYSDNAEPGWMWFENYVTYANPRLPQALLETGNLLEDELLLRIGKESLDFLVETQFVDGVFHPIGTEGWYKKGGERAYYDQQPIEASCMVEACMTAYRVLSEKRYMDHSHSAFQWFHGNNSSGLTLVDKDNYTCFDGLTSEGLNQNKGAESTISYLLADLSVNAGTQQRI